MKKGFTFKTIRVLVVVAISFGVALLLITLKPKADRQAPVETGQLVETMIARSENIQMSVEAYGTVRPREVLELVAEVRGRIIARGPSFDAGRLVKKGAMLATIDPRSYRLEVDRRRVQITQVEADLKRLDQEIRNLAENRRISETDTRLARAEYERSKTLSERKVVARTALDQAEQRYLASVERLQGIKNQQALAGPRKEQLGAQLEMSKVLLRQAEIDLERTRIVATFGGWVLERKVEVGEYVAVGQHLGKIYRSGAYEVEVRIPVNDLKWLPELTGAETAPAAAVVFRGDSAPVKWQGRVSRVLAAMDATTRTLPVIIDVEKAENAETPPGQVSLRPGTFVTVHIEGRKLEGVFRLPRPAVHPGDRVYTVNGDRLGIRKVDVIRHYKDSVYVAGGISDGESLVTTPLAGPHEGMQIRTE